MRDIDLAIEVLEAEKLTFAAVKNGKVFYKSKERGIRPVYNAYIQMKEELKDASIADRVVGKAAALLYSDANIKRLFTKVTSEEAVKVLDTTNIQINYDNKVPYIKNRDKTGCCPVETLSKDVSDIKTLIDRLEKFFN